MKILYISIFCLLTVFLFDAKSQDGHYSQFFNSPLFLNPAETGLVPQNIRIAGHYRSQWWALGESFKTRSVAVDKAVNNKIGIGGFWLKNDAGEGTVQTSHLQLSFAYHIKMSKENFLSFGLQSGLYRKSFDPTKLIFGSQYTPDASTLQQSGEVFAKTSISVFDVNFGALWRYISDDYNIKLGFSISHLNEPDQTFSSEQAVPLFSKYNIYSEFEKPINEQFTLIPSVRYSMQSEAQNFLVGAKVRYAIDSKKAFTIGAYDRLNDAFVAYAGFNLNNTYELGFSYDINHSELKKATSGQGAVEFCLTINLKSNVKKLPKEDIVENPIIPIDTTKKDTTKIAEVPNLDKDGDGIPDDEDKCPDEFGLKKYDGCPFRDTDGDGITDDEDACPEVYGIPELNGCPETEEKTNPYGSIIINNNEHAIVEKVIVYFDKDKSFLKEIYRPKLREMVKSLSKNPNYALVISGHTDSDGSSVYNIQLGESRANTIRIYLIENGLLPSALEAITHGENNPVRENTTKEGMAFNRRVEVLIIRMK